MLTKTELRALLNKYDLRPNKLLGQNFLIDKNMQQKILNYCDLQSEDIVLEIGPGLSALTFDIAKRVKHIFAVEKDKVLSNVLKELADGYDNIDIISCDILKFNIKEIFKGRKLKVIGNLPYYITSPIISYLIENRSFIDSIFVTVQKEVARRLAAGPGSKEYSPISIYTQFYTDVRLLFLIAKGVFYPQPEIDSAVIKLDILKEPRVKVKDDEFFFKIVRTVFTQRRKTLLNNLASGHIVGLGKKEIEDLLKDLKIDPADRPEDLSIQDFARIAAKLQNATS